MTHASSLTSQVEETTLKQMLANLVIAKKAAAAAAAAEAKARKEKKAQGKNQTKHPKQGDGQDRDKNPGTGGDQPEAKHTDAKRRYADDEWKKQRREWEREVEGEGGAKTTGTEGQEEPGSRR